MSRLSRSDISGVALSVFLSLLAAGSVQGQTPGTVEQAVRGDTRDTRVDLTRKEPYLIFPGDNTRMNVLWQLTTTETSTLEWGVDTTYALGSVQTTEYGIDHQHAYTVTGLTPGSTYYYRVTVQEVSHRGVFRAAPPADGTNLKFIAYGDTRTYPAIHNQVAGAIVGTYTSDPEYRSFALAVGDLVSNGDSETEWTNQFFSPSYPNIRKLMADLPYHSCIGNHDGTGPLFMKYFPYPFAAARYWSFDYGPAHFAVVDQYTPFGGGSAQLQWLTSDLAASSKPWKFICLHAPGWSADGGHENNITVQTYIQPLCVQYGVSIVFGGHNHYYARASVNGVEHVTTGGGGAPLYTPNPGYPYIVAAAREYHYCKVSIQGGSLSFQAVKPDGTVLDSFTLQAPSGVGDGTRPRDSQAAVFAYPNPFTSETVFDWTATRTGPRRLVLFDVTGHPIRAFSVSEPGRHTVRWDGTDDRGRRLGTGIYLYGLEPRQDDGPRKLLLLR